MDAIKRSIYAAAVEAIIDHDDKAADQAAYVAFMDAVEQGMQAAIAEKTPDDPISELELEMLRQDVVASLQNGRTALANGDEEMLLQWASQIIVRSVVPVMEVVAEAATVAANGFADVDACANLIIDFSTGMLASGIGNNDAPMISMAVSLAHCRRDERPDDWIVRKAQAVHASIMDEE